MSEKILYLTFEEQLNRFKEQGIVVNDDKRALLKLQTIGYYKLKRFAYSSRNGNEEVPFEKLNFDDLVLRYYQDKNLRIFLLHAIEKIEVSVKVSTSFVLGKKYGAFGYINFSKWTDLKKFQLSDNSTEESNKKKKSIAHRKQLEAKFLTDLKNKIRRSSLPDLSVERNLNDGLPSIWLAMDVLTFGDLVFMLNKMSNNNVNEIAAIYDLKKDEFLSWMSCLNFIRNVCAHNSNIIDLRLDTLPQIKDEWKNDLYKRSDNRYTNRIALVFFIIKSLIDKINSHYQYTDITRSMSKMISGSDIRARSFGFANVSSFNRLLPKKNSPYSKNLTKKRNRKIS